jgi:exopolysaccharide biosynthesis polyprenyl glycosylphosphotransferase
MRNSAPDHAALRAVESDTEAKPSPQAERRARVSQPRLAIPLPSYDVRVRRELAHRRALLAMVRHFLRVTALHLLDLGATVAAGIVASKITGVAVSTEILALITGLVLVGLNARGAYRASHGRRDPWRIVSGIAVGIAATILVGSLLPGYFTAAYVAAFGTFTAIGVVFERTIVDLAVQQIYERGVGLTRAVIVGRQSDVDMVSAALRDGQRDHKVVGYVSPSSIRDSAALGSLAELETVVQRESPAELILCAALPAEAHRRVADICIRNGVSILAVPTWTKSNRGWAEPVRVGAIPGYWLHPVRLEVPALVLKRAMDVALTLALLVLCLPLLALIAVAIKLDSRGPVFFRQRRVGLGGREFTMWKFRSMQHLSENRHEDVAHLNHYADSRLFKLVDDPRITTVGRWLRRLSLDELPQLFNVIQGEMSLVGPRPPLPAEVRKYAPEHLVRLSVVPGITGPWQTGGRNLITDFEQVVGLERQYIERWSLALDLKILLKTIFVVLSGKGAY